MALRCCPGAIGQSLLKNSSLCHSNSCSFSQARTRCNFLFWVCIKPLGHHLG
jgi:hypothetical protein